MKNASCMHGYLFDAEHAYSKPNWPRSAQARDANAGGLVCFLSQNIFRIMIGVSHDASLMVAGIMVVLRLNQIMYT